MTLHWSWVLSFLCYGPANCPRSLSYAQHIVTTLEEFKKKLYLFVNGAFFVETKPRRQYHSRRQKNVRNKACVTLSPFLGAITANKNSGEHDGASSSSSSSFATCSSRSSPNFKNDKWTANHTYTHTNAHTMRIKKLLSVLPKLCSEYIIIRPHKIC